MTCMENCADTNNNLILNKLPEDERQAIPLGYNNQFLLSLHPYITKGRRSRRENTRKYKEQKSLWVSPITSYYFFLLLFFHNMYFAFGVFISYFFLFYCLLGFVLHITVRSTCLLQAVSFLKFSVFFNLLNFLFC